MPDSIMDQVRAEQAADKERRERSAQEAADKARVRMDADRAKFAREAPEIIAIMREYGVKPERVTAFLHRSNGIHDSYTYVGEIGKGWMVRGVDDYQATYPTTRHVALLEDGSCIPCIPPRPNMPLITRDVLVVIDGQAKQDYWGMETHAVANVRRLIGE